MLEKAHKYSDAAESAIGGAVGMAKTAVTKGYDLAAQEAPLVLQEFLVWRFTTSVVKFIVPFALFVIAIWVFLRNFPKWIDSFRADQAGTRSRDFRDADARQIKTGLAGWFGLVFTIITCIWTISCVDNLMTAVQIKVAPRVYVVEQAVDLYKNIK